MDATNTTRWSTRSLAPSERAIVDVLFADPGTFIVAHQTPDQCYVLGRITVTDEATDTGPAATFRELGTSGDLTAERARAAA